MFCEILEEWSRGTLLPQSSQNGNGERRAVQLQQTKCRVSQHLADCWLPVT